MPLEPPARTEAVSPRDEIASQLLDSEQLPVEDDDTPGAQHRLEYCLAEQAQRSGVKVPSRSFGSQIAAFKTRELAPLLLPRPR
jgi:hypothetical protein